MQLRWGLLLITLAFNVQGMQSDELKDIQQQIKEKQAQIDQRLAESKKLQAQLRQAELNIAETAKALQETQTALDGNRTQQSQLRQEQIQIRQQQKQQQQVLASQLVNMYMAGNYDYAKMLFNLEDASKFERTLTYYQYLTDARKEQIDKFRALVAQLKRVDASLQEKQAELSRLESEQRKQNTLLVQQQSMREATLAQVKKQIDSEAAQIEQLQINEQALLKAIEEAESAAAQRPVNLSGLSGLKGQLMVPTRGQLRDMFGKRRQGQVRWKGVLFAGNTGAPVRAIYDGKVLYSDWLRGFGLVTVLDHGDGYMSLYGHNQALLKKAGDEVQAGETIALVGQSGGQNAPNLYFEIRHKGKAVDPVDWLKLR